MREFKHETIIITKEAWDCLSNYHRKMQYLKPLTQEQLDKAWNRRYCRNCGANPQTHPIAENEIRISVYSLGIMLDKVKDILTSNGFTFREDGFIEEGFDL